MCSLPLARPTPKIKEWHFTLITLCGLLLVRLYSYVLLHSPNSPNISLCRVFYLYLFFLSLRVTATLFKLNDLFSTFYSLNHLFFMLSCTCIASSPSCPPHPFVLFSSLISSSPLFCIIDPSHLYHPTLPSYPLLLSPPFFHQMKHYNSWESRGREALAIVFVPNSVDLSLIWLTCRSLHLGELRGAPIANARADRDYRKGVLEQLASFGQTGSFRCQCMLCLSATPCPCPVG